MLLTSALISGLGLGSMYGLMALGFYITYAVSATVNFAQGSSMMLGAMLTYTFSQTLGWPWPLALLAALALCALYGMLVEFVAVRPFARRGSNAWLMSTVALGIVLDNIVMFTFGKEPRNLPSALAVTPHPAGRAGAGGVSPAIADSRGGPGPGGCAAFRGAAHALGRGACSRSSRTAMPRASWVFRSALWCWRRLPCPPCLPVWPALWWRRSLTCIPTWARCSASRLLPWAILGGITSAWGVMLAGLLFGAGEALITATLGSSYTQIIMFSLVIAVLALRPNGMFGRLEVKKV